MSIHCTSKCSYQHEGFCTFTQLPSTVTVMHHPSDGDCPYFVSGSCFTRE